MKHNRLTKILAVLLLLALALCSLVSCGSNAGNAEDASGQHGALSWSYSKDTKTLTLTGAGALASFENSDSVHWAAVRTSAKKLVIGEGITAIGNYAFYYMAALEEVSLPTTLTTIGDYAFGFCTSLSTVLIPKGVTELGKGAFEGCGALKSIFLPDTVTRLGDRAFAFCYSMVDVIAAGELELVGSWSFKGCRALESLTFRTAQSADAFAADAFEDANGKSFENANKNDSETGSTKVVVKYMLDGAVIETKEQTVERGGEYSIPTPTKDGYTPDKLTVTGKVNGESVKEETVTYTKNPEAETEPEPEQEEETVSAMTYVAIGIMVVILVGIGVGAFLLMRADKKNAKKGTTVRKSDKQKGKK